MLSLDKLGPRSAVAWAKEAIDNVAGLKDKVAGLSAQEMAEHLCWSDGFLTAIAIGPNDVPPLDWLPDLFHGSIDEIADLENLPEAMAAAALGWTRLLTVLRDDPEQYAPLYHDDADRGALAVEWAHGFYAGMHKSWSAWRPLLEDRVHRDLLVPVLMLLRDQDGSVIASLREAVEGVGQSLEELTEEAASEVADSVRGLYAYWNDLRPDPLVSSPWRRRTTLRSQDKTGRNEPCPCGSGRKYKKCCLD